MTDKAKVFLIADKALTLRPTENEEKLRTFMNVSQTAFWHLTLMVHNLIDGSNKMNVARFIAYNHLTNDKDLHKEVNLEKRVDYIYNQFTNLNKNTVEFWDKMFLNFRQYTQELLRKL